MVGPRTPGRAHTSMAARAVDSWAMLGTNLSVKKDSGEWDTEANRLLLMDRKDFNRLGLGVDDLIDAVRGRTADSNVHALR